MPKPGEVDEAALEAKGGMRALAQYHRKLNTVLALQSAQAGVEYGGKLAALREVARLHEVSEGTLRNWQMAYRKRGTQGLVPQWGKTEGLNSIPRPLRGELLAMGRGRIRKTKAQIYRYACNWCRAKGCIAPSRYAVSRFLDRHLQPRHAAEPRNGKKAHEKSRALLEQASAKGGHR